MNTSGTVALLGALAIVGGVTIFVVTRQPAARRPEGWSPTGGTPKGAAGPARPKKKGDVGKVIDGVGAVLKLAF